MYLGSVSRLVSFTLGIHSCEVRFDDFGENQLLLGPMFQRIMTRSGAVGAICSPSRVQLTQGQVGMSPVAGRGGERRDGSR